MMKRLVVLIVLASVFNSSCRSKKASLTQKPDPVVFTYGKDTVYRSEFERIYSKNNRDSTPDEKAIREYLDLYINFKLKVKEAYELKLDTQESFITELAGYRKQLAQPYLVDKKVTDSLVQEAYDRMRFEVNSSHILISCAEDAAPSDTLIAYNKAMDLRKRVMNGESFDSVAMKYSDDPSARQNGGTLGYYTAFQLVYPYENAMYGTAVGQISQPVRSRFGYHIIKVNDKRAARGEVRVAHIMIKTQGVPAEKAADLKRKADSLYMRLLKGESFADLCKQYSEDYSTKNNGGELNWFSGTTNLPTELKEAAFALSHTGEFSKPVKTDYGWHIVRLLEKRELPAKEKMLETIKSKINRDSRSELNRSVVLNKIKTSNKFTEDPKALKKFISLTDSSIISGKWKRSEATNKSVMLFKLGTTNYTYQDFASYIERNQTAKPGQSKESIINNLYTEFVSFSAFNYEEKNLDVKEPAFRDLMQEYKDGILLFALTDQKIWSRSVNDTDGLKKYFDKVRSSYNWSERADAVIYECADAKLADQLYKMLSAKKPESDSNLLKRLNKQNPLNLNIRQDLYEKGSEEALKMLEDSSWAPGLYKTNFGGRYYVVRIKKIHPAEPKALSDVKGMVTSEYQNYLEKEWLKELKAKYPVVVNEETVKSLFR